MKNFKFFLFSLLFLAGLSTVCAQVSIDSSNTAPGIFYSMPQVWDKYGHSILLGLFILVSCLSTAQLILKRIPTPESVKIQGIIGKLLDMLTFFQSDVLKKTLGLLLIAGLFFLSGCFVQKDCHVTGVSVTTNKQTVCLECDSLGADVLQWIETNAKLKLQKNTK